jgi:hypothetical protein
MRKAVLGGALLAGALVFSPLGAVAAFAGGTPAPGSSTPACSVPTESDLSISPSTPEVVDTVGGTAYETLDVISDEDIVPVIDFTVSPPAPTTGATPVMSWSLDGQGADAEVFSGGTGGWREGAVIGQVEPGAHALVFGFTFAAGMPAGSYTASFDWTGPQSCDDNGYESPSSPTYTISLPSLSYDPPTAAGGSGGGPGVSGGQPTSGAPVADSSASAGAAASASATATASAGAGSASGAAAAALPSTPSASSSTEGTVTLTTSAPTSSDSEAVWILVTVFMVMLAGSVASGSIVKRRRLALQSATDETSAESAGPAQAEAAPDSDAGDNAGPDYEA